MNNDIEIAQNTQLEHILNVAKKLDINEDDLEYYGKYKAKLSDELINRVKDNKINFIFLFIEQSIRHLLEKVRQQLQ